MTVASGTFTRSGSVLHGFRAWPVVQTHTGLPNCFSKPIPCPVFLLVLSRAKMLLDFISFLHKCVTFKFKKKNWCLLWKRYL